MSDDLNTVSGRCRLLRARGWRRSLGWWYRPVAGWGGRPAPRQELFGTARAFQFERLRLLLPAGEPPGAGEGL
jgi:hypothetical protein